MGCRSVDTAGAWSVSVSSMRQRRELATWIRHTRSSWYSTLTPMAGPHGSSVMSSHSCSICFLASDRFRRRMESTPTKVVRSLVLHREINIPVSMDLRSSRPSQGSSALEYSVPSSGGLRLGTTSTLPPWEASCRSASTSTQSSSGGSMTIIVSPPSSSCSTILGSDALWHSGAVLGDVSGLSRAGWSVPRWRCRGCLL